MPSSQTEQQQITFEEVSGLLAEARNYWICTLRPDSRPHAAPVWAVWRNGCVVFSSPASTVKARNLEANAHATVHLESGDEVVIVDGRATQVDDEEELRALGTAFTEKYGGVTGVAYDLVQARSMGMAVISVRAEVVRGWHAGAAFLANRWTLGPDGLPVNRTSVSAADLA
ncbi:pyridoxamine 5'-phosphate oxidase family protein [Micromonospora carbonacea]|jgi:PPOX class probable F420-dependent enzyme|uniref:pyridoxamine 5'-phosphate oxidase family protein n=1 Tax=Micromonospora carbonacea TaxID=47853 RepID=UPI003D762470